MPDLNTELRYATTEVCAALVDIDRILPSIVNTVGLLATGGGPHVPIPPRLTEYVVEGANLLLAAAQDLRTKAIALNELAGTSE